MLVKLSIFDIMGREIAILENSFILAGKHNVVFDANNMVSGIYFYQLKIGTTIHSKKMLLIK
jgi:hypothetical protein